MTDFAHVVDRIFNTPLCIHPTKAATILSVLGPRLGLASESIGALAPDTAGDAAASPAGQPERLAAVPGAIETRKPYVVTDRGVAVVGVSGTLVHRAAARMRPMSGMTSYGEIEAQLVDAANDQSMRGIMIDIDSGGGEVNAVFDLSDTIYKLRRVKPIWAIADEHMFSAAYALGSAAERVIVPRTGGVGSIGVIAMHLDVSDRDKAEGLRFTTLYAGARKNDFNPHERLSSEALERLQAMIDADYGLFVETVARNRGLTARAVAATEAATYAGIADEAVKAKLADEVLPFRDALAAFTERLDRGPGARLIRANAHNQDRGENTMSKTESTTTEQPAAAGSADAAPATVAGTETPPPAAATATATGNVVQLGEARAEGRAEAAALVELCALAGRPELAGNYIAEGLSADAARQRLLALRANADAAIVTDGTHTGTTAAAPAKLSASAIYTRRAEQAAAAQPRSR